MVADTNGRIKAVWSNDGPTYGPGVTPDRLDPSVHDNAPDLLFDEAKDLPTPGSAARSGASGRNEGLVDHNDLLHPDERPKPKD